MVSGRINRTFAVVIPAKEEWECGHSPMVLNGLIFYTDGSKASQGTGPGMYGKNLKQKLTRSQEL